MVCPSLEALPVGNGPGCRSFAGIVRPRHPVRSHSGQVWKRSVIGSASLAALGRVAIPVRVDVGIAVARWSYSSARRQLSGPDLHRPRGLRVWCHRRSDGVDSPSPNHAADPHLPVETLRSRRCRSSPTQAGGRHVLDGGPRITGLIASPDLLGFQPASGTHAPGSKERSPGCPRRRSSESVDAERVWSRLHPRASPAHRRDSSVTRERGGSRRRSRRPRCHAVAPVQGLLAGCCTARRSTSHSVVLVLMPLVHGPSQVQVMLSSRALPGHVQVAHATRHRSRGAAGRTSLTVVQAPAVRVSSPLSGTARTRNS